MKHSKQSHSSKAKTISASPETLSLRGVNENNLKNLDLDIAHDSLVAVTGVSGSGKTTLAFDTIYAEGGRRYIETFSPYTRQFLDRLNKPDLKSITGVRPALALEQQNRVNSSRSTVGTVTEINDYIKVVWSLLAELKCPSCSLIVSKGTVSNTTKSLFEYAKDHSGLSLLCFELAVVGSASLSAMVETLIAQGFLRYFDSKSQSVQLLETLLELEPISKRRAAEIEELITDNGKLLIVVDRFKNLSSAKEDRLSGSIRQAFAFGHGLLTCVLVGKNTSSSLQFSEGYRCNSCGENYSSPRPSLFTYNSPLGACTTCQGFGKVLQIDPKLVIQDERKTIGKKVIHCFSTPATSRIFSKLKEFCAEQSIPLDVPWSSLKEEHKEKIFQGTKTKSGFPGVFPFFEKMKKKRHKMHVRMMFARYRSEFLCSDCKGSRLKPEALHYLVNKQTLPEIWQLPVDESLEFFEGLAKGIGGEDPLRIPLHQVISRLNYLDDIGLNYLTLDRQTKTLSGGESQRVNLTSILGAELVNTTLVLDEPTIGLHGVDTERLIKSLHELSAKGNSVYVVEHDQEVISSADEVIDIGPLAGSHGGEVIFKGSVSELKKCKESLTNDYLFKKVELSKSNNKPKNKRALCIKNINAQNLQNLSLTIPLEQFVVISGVSGSGKSTLVKEAVYGSYERIKKGEQANELGKAPASKIEALLGTEHFDDMILIDQSPIGKSPRSNAATYTKAWDAIRQCLASSPKAEELGLTKSAFSFNVDGGRCPACKGAGQLRIEMQFLSDVFVECDECSGTRFQEQIRTVKFCGKSVVDFLNMTLEDAVRFFEEEATGVKVADIASTLTPLLNLGLGYLLLGQPLNTVSGGEAQRIKLASYLSPRFKSKCLFILDEPTTGLHPHNINQLLETFSLLRERGHSIICIEHNFDVIAAADWVIDLGPGGGKRGGQIVAEGSPKDLVENYSKSSATARLLAKSLKGRKPAKKAITLENTFRKNIKADKSIRIEGARHHNLKEVSVSIPKGVMNVFTGVSGSGKSSIAFDILFSEGQRRYIDCLSPYARQYIKQLSRADVDRVSGIPPTIAISQRTSPPLGISTLATTTEIYQFLRLMYSKIGVQHCPTDNTPIASLSSEALIEMISRRYDGERLFIFAPSVQGRKGYYNDLFRRALKAEITQAKIDGEMRSLDADMRLERHKLHWISLLVASVKVTKKNRSLIKQAVEQALVLGAGAVEVCLGDAYSKAQILSIDRLCPDCGRGYLPLDPQDFSFRSRRGVCKQCDGRGVIAKGRHTDVSCPKCHGARISEIGRNVFIGGKRIHELTAMNPQELLDWLHVLKMSEKEKTIAEPIHGELKSRLQVIIDVGLDYLALDRDASSISGGEAQRLRLACALGSPLSGVCYILDEPSIGLHPSDHSMLMKTLTNLKERGNTLIVVEHDEDTIRAADNVIDIGPGGGATGGTLVFQGSPKELEKNMLSKTAEALRDRSKGKGKVAKSSIPKSISSITIEGARANNLKDVTVSFPKHKLSVVMGVSGAGKSSLVHRSLVPAIVEEFEGEKEREKYYPKTWDSFTSFHDLEKYIEIDQKSIGKTPTSTPSSYLGIFNEIRKIYASLPEAKAQGYSASHFSFNTGKGRCEICGGRGYIKIPMSFLPDASTKCDACRGLRYNDQTLEIRYRGVSIGEALEKTFSESRMLFSNHRKIVRTIDYVLELGLGYLSLGQASHTLSGGEAQRIKIAKELGAREAKNNLYVLDEPTVGLHMTDVERLFNVLHKLTELENTVIVIEHNTDIIRRADYLVELGPRAGDKGGKLLFAGTPYQLVKSKKKTPTKQFL